MEKLEEKRLLVLGGTLSTYDVVKTAHQLGIYVIVTDYLESGITKKIADETALISTTDMEALGRFIREKKIDGVFTGASEFNIRNMILLCSREKLPVYTSLKLWDLCSNKKRFKEICRKYQVPVVPEYNPDLKTEIRYPVIVKPVDSYSGHGITVCKKEEELEAAIIKAKSYSKSGQIVVEKYVEGDNVEVYYLVQQGKVMLTAASDRYTNKMQQGSPVPIAFYHPSRHLSEYLEEIHPKICTMFKSLGVKNGVFFMESFVEDGRFMFYEMGLRLNATMEYHFIEYFNGFNPLKMMIRYALTGSMGNSVEEKNNPYFNGSACEVALLLNKGKIHRIIGMDDIDKRSGVIHSIRFYREGDTVSEVGNLNQHFARIKVVAQNDEELEMLIDDLYKEISVLDEKGNEMLVKEREKRIYA